MKKKKKKKDKKRGAGSLTHSFYDRPRTPPGSAAFDGLSEQAPPDFAEFMRSVQAPLAGALKPGGAGAPVVAVSVAARLLEEKTSEVWARSSVARACGKGCSFCCRGVRVDVTAPEVMRAVSFARERLSPEMMAQVAQRAKENTEKTHGKTPLQYPVRLPCAFLSDDGGCLVYEARPLACQNEHSLDAAACEEACKGQELGQDLPTPHNFEVSGVGGLYIVALRGALSTAGLDASSFELQEALHIALSTPSAFDEWRAGKPIFAPALADQTMDEGFIPPRLVKLGAKDR